jgi:ABC-type multidrug transport system fused ATPase/permease subunit
MPYEALARARRFGRRSVGPIAAVAISGIAAAAALVLLLILLPLMAELLASGGSLTIPIGERKSIDGLGVQPTDSNGQVVHYQRSGLLPAVWELRRSPIGAALRGAYTSWPPLRHNSSGLLAIVGCQWILAVTAAGMLYLLAWSVKWTAIGVAGVLRKQIHDQAQRLGPGDLFIGQEMTARELFADKVNAVRRGLAVWYWIWPHAALFAAAILALALSVHFWLSAATILLAILCWWMIALLRGQAKSTSAMMAARAEGILALLLDRLRQNRLQYGSERVGNGELADDLRRYHAAVLRRETAAAMVGPLVTALVLVGLGVVLLLAGYNVLASSPRLTFSEVVLLCGALLALVYPLICVERLLERIAEADEAAHDIFNYLDRQPRVGELAEAEALPRLNRQITLDRVTLADRNGHLLLDDVSCALPAGRPVVLFASDQATLLAIAGLLPRFCDPAAGQVLFDGKDMRRARIDSVREQVALILPDRLLASGTLAENLDGNRFTADEIVTAMKRAGAYDFVQSLPEGLQTEIGAAGLTLSVGQAIRIGLARVALIKPSVVVIAEPAEDIDQQTAERIAEALENVSKGMTLVILARRLATLRAAQRILLFHEGRLLADGTHQELLRRNDLYRHLNYVRFNEFRDNVR